MSGTLSSVGNQEFYAHLPSDRIHFNCHHVRDADNGLLFGAAVHHVFFDTGIRTII